MAKAPLSELFSTLKSYTQKLSDGERTPAEIASALNDWAHESAESLKAKIHDEVESAVLKMGFVKREEFDALAREVASLKRKAPAKKSAVKKPVKKVAKKTAKKKVAK
jgi:BMFP domain-containing protein YqiC